MTAGKLIEELQKFPTEKEVLVLCDKGVFNFNIEEEEDMRDEEVIAAEIKAGTYITAIYLITTQEIR